MLLRQQGSRGARFNVSSQGTRSNACLDLASELLRGNRGSCLCDRPVGRVGALAGRIGRRVDSNRELRTTPRSAIYLDPTIRRNIRECAHAGRDASKSYGATGRGSSPSVQSHSSSIRDALRWRLNRRPKPDQSPFCTTNILSDCI